MQTPTISHEDVNSPSDNKEEDDGSDAESDERLDSVAYDPERLKAFNVWRCINFSIFNH